MKTYLFLFICILSLKAFAQAVPDSVQQTAFTTEDIRFNIGGIVLEGTLFKPEKPYAAVVLVHGSGQEGRMVNMATYLAKNGITVFTYDKRGVGKSGGIYAGPEVGTNNIDASNLDLLASDAAEAAQTLLKNLPVKTAPVGLMGFSQAGWVIPLAATKNPKISFMVLFSGPVVSSLEQLRFQFYTQGNGKFWETHTESEARMHIRTDPDRYAFTGTDPQEALRKLEIPGLWLFGGKDIQAPVGLSTERLDALKAKGKQYDYRLYPELGHNTSSLNSPEPIRAGIKWIRALKMKQRIAQ